MALALGGDLDAQLVEFAAEFAFAGAEDFELVLRFGAARVELLELPEPAGGLRFQTAHPIRRLAMPRLAAGAFAFEILLLALGLPGLALDHRELPAERGDEERGVLLFLARFVEPRLGGFDFRDERVAPHGHAVDLLLKLRGLGFERVDLVFPREHGVHGLAGLARVEHAVAGEHLARERDDRRAAHLRENAERRFEVRHEHGVVDQPLDEPLHRGLRRDFADEPVDRALGQRQRFGFVVEMALQLPQRERCLAEFLRGQRLHHRLRDHRVLHHDRLEIHAQRGFRGGDKLRCDLDELRERAEDCGFEKVGVVQPAEHGLGALRETFAARVQRAQHFELRVFLRQRTLRVAEFAVGFRQPALRLAELRLAVGELGGARLGVADRALDFRLGVAQPVGELREGKGELLQFARQNAQPRLRAIALLRDAGNLPAQAADAALDARRVIRHAADRPLRLLPLAGQRGDGGLLFLHDPQLAREHRGDLLQLDVGVVKLRLGDAEFLLRARHVRAVALDELGEFLGAFLVENDPALVVRNAGAQIVDRLSRLVQPLLHFLQRRPLHGDLAFARLDLLLALHLPVGEPRQLLLGGHARLLQGVELPLRRVRFQHLQIADQRLITPRLARLPLERTDLPLDLFHDVLEPQQICLRGLQLAQRLALLRLVFRDARRLLENRAPVLRSRRQDHVDLALLHDRIRRAPDARVHEKLLDVLQPARRFVQQILAPAVLENAARDRDLMPVQPELLLTFGKGHRNLRHPDARARIRAAENHVRHFAAPQRLGRLLAQHPPHGVEHVGFSAPVRPDHCGHAAMKFHLGFGGERLEAEEFERLEIHGGRGVKMRVKSGAKARKLSAPDLPASTIYWGQSKNLALDGVVSGSNRANGQFSLGRSGFGGETRRAFSASRRKCGTRLGSAAS